VSTDNAGIFIYQADDLSFIRKIDREAGLSVYHIRKCFQDRQSNIWIATSGGGIYKYAPSNFRHFDRETGLKGNRVYAVLQAGQSIIASNSEAGLVRIDTLGVRDTLDDARLLNVKIKALAEDTDGNTWIGTEGRGLFLAGISRRDSIVIDTSSQPVRIDTFHLQKPFVRILDESVGFHGRWIRKIVLNQDEVWIGTYSAGIYRFRYDVDDDRLYELKHFGRSEGINELLINDMLADTLGRIWYGTKKGHLGYIEKDKVHHLGNVLEQNTDIVSLCIKGEQLYLGTAGRGIWFSELYDTQDFVQLQGIKELTSNNIYQLIFDADGNLWAGTERGVDKIILNNVEQIQDLFHYNRNDGFLGIETCQNAAIRDRNDNLWFGTIYGLTRYQPLENKRVNIKPALAFESIEIFYEELDSVDPKLWFEQGRTLQLAPRENHLAFRYRTVDINNPEEIQYRWRLNQAPWSPWLEDNAINFAGLSYGDYLFEAQSRNEGWEESDVIGFRFNIARPLYEEPWFQRTVIGVIVLIIAGLIWRYIRRWKARNEAERSRLEMENHLLSLEQKALRLQMNPHFVFNVLNGIKAMSGGDTEKMHLTINKFATLLRAILNNSRQDHITLAQEVDTLRNYIEVEQLMATQPFNYEIEIEDSLDTEEILIPPMLIQPFVENAIRHGIMAVQREGELRIRFWQKDHYLYCAVTDNGIGINASRNGKKNTSHQSVALEVTRERIESLSGKESLQIEELIDPDGKVAGTKASFRLPVMTDY
ncbi:MAG: histidine kinase, partial [Lewinella sp.]|nr:histidine kinase [Lewinella sp.]